MGINIQEIMYYTVNDISFWASFTIILFVFYYNIIHNRKPYSGWFISKRLKIILNTNIRSYCINDKPWFSGILPNCINILDRKFYSLIGKAFLSYFIYNLPTTVKRPIHSIQCELPKVIKIPHIL